VKRALKRDRSGWPENPHRPGPAGKAPSPATATRRPIIPDGAATHPGGARGTGPGQSSRRAESFGLDFISVTGTRKENLTLNRPRANAGVRRGGRGRPPLRPLEVRYQE
jgi:hypothetical protein